ncbi:MAG TPA: isoprenylcysteine carboxylmethyltransferase family protein [Candidatus Limnocylindrales bacterium]|jgi:protein-S-isoprenylcysteine O-methyltransferase Ste14|nr:isoprenylcysteine carboxylmethyltransferase family protein [Candidatus Limnocylindrales bacterium]
MKRIFGFAFGIICYAVFLFVFLRAVWFVWTMDGLAAQAPLTSALLINAALLGAFAVQHSGMARQSFKRAWTKIVPPLLERSTYVLMASLVLLSVVEFWQPLPGTIWSVRNPAAVVLLNVLFWFGWALLFTCTLLIDHFDLFGLKQSWKYLRNEKYEPPVFRTPGPYRLVRHPLYLGFLIAFWSAPHMTSGRLFFAVMCTGYILVAIQLEERDLVTFHGESYRVYRSGVSMIVPLPGKQANAAQSKANLMPETQQSIRSK